MNDALPIIAGTIGAVLGFAGTLLGLELAGFGNRADPIMSGLVALIVLAPAGALVGLVLGVKIGTTIRGGDNAGGFVVNSLKALAIVGGAAVAVGGIYYFDALATATPWLNPNGGTPVLLFEVRLPAGAPLPAAAAVEIELQTDQNRMPGAVRSDQFRRDGDQPVIAGNVELAFRTANRQLKVKVTGQPDRVLRIGLTDKAPHTPEFGTWQRQSDGSEVRYRAKWPGQD